MPRLLYAWEYGADLGHVSVFLPIAKKLRALGWQIKFAIPDSVPAAKILQQNDFEYLKAPGSSVSYSNRRTDSHAELIHSLSSLGNGAAFMFMLRSWLGILDDERPDGVVGDYAVTALIAARLMHIPSVAINLGFFYPDLDQPLPRFGEVVNAACGTIGNEGSRTGPAQVEQSLLTMMNDVLGELDAPPLETFKDIYRADKVLRLTFAELSAFTPAAGRHFLGAVISENGGTDPQWPLSERSAKKIFVYLKPGTSRVLPIMDALAGKSDDSVIAYLPGCPEQVRQAYACPHLRISSEPLDISKVLCDVDLVICHAGAGLIAQSLLAGKPLLLVPTQTEQELNARCVVRLGAGLDTLDAPRDADKKDMREKIDRLLCESVFKENAEAFRRRNRAADIDQVADEIIQLLAGPKSEAMRRAQPVHVIRRPRDLTFRDFDVVFLSFDEPNADDHWRKLKEVAPDAIRVHGVKGFDAAHKAAARAARTERFILVDADNVIDPRFLRMEATVPPAFEHGLWQWSGVNEVTGLSYPFGGLKVWPTDVVKHMRTHEMCTPEDGPLLLDFWAQPAYCAFYPSFSRNHTNASPYQSFRSAFREVVKLAGSCGMTRSADGIEALAHLPHYRRMSIWMSVGADVENGWWSMLGARMGFINCFDSDFSAARINTYDWFEAHWLGIFGRIASARERTESSGGMIRCSLVNQTLIDEVARMGDAVRSMLKKPPVLDMTAEQSAQFKAAMAQKIQKDRALFSPFDSVTDF